VLTDLSMPRLNGHALIAALKRNPETADMPVFMFSSSGAPNDRRVAMDAGCRAYFEKPASMDGLIDIMHEVHAAVCGVGVQRG
jgi:CheY-like chemotaxis protein